MLFLLTNYERGGNNEMFAQLHGTSESSKDEDDKWQLGGTKTLYLQTEFYKMDVIVPNAGSRLFEVDLDRTQESVTDTKKQNKTIDVDIVPSRKHS